MFPRQQLQKPKQDGCSDQMPPTTKSPLAMLIETCNRIGFEQDYVTQITTTINSKEENANSNSQLRRKSDTKISYVTGKALEKRIRPNESAPNIDGIKIYPKGFCVNSKSTNEHVLTNFAIKGNNTTSPVQPSNASWPSMYNLMSHQLLLNDPSFQSTYLSLSSLALRDPQSFLQLLATNPFLPKIGAQQQQIDQLRSFKNNFSHHQTLQSSVSLPKQSNLPGNNYHRNMEDVKNDQHFCNWSYGGTKFCNKNFSSIDELSIHIRNHIAEAVFVNHHQQIGSEIPGLFYGGQIRDTSIAGQKRYSLPDIYPKINVDSRHTPSEPTGAYNNAYGWPRFHPYH